ncbi:MAG: DUF4838 domain-containing protein [Clostridiales bacterium]|jgi:hypothetical protein|nr:DUF4838 domain-containing protein [Clostridiales bacterium]
MKMLRKFIVFAAAALLLLPLAACSKGKPEEAGGNVVILTPSDVPLAKNGVTDYRVVIAEDDVDAGSAAASELVYFFEKATGATLEVTDAAATWSEDAKYLSIGRNKLAQSAGVSPDADLGRSGFNIVTKGNSVFMLGRTIQADQWAVYDFMRYSFGYEAYAGDSYTLNQSTALNLTKMTVRNVPSFDVRFAPTTPMQDYPDWARRLRYEVQRDVIMAPNTDLWATTLDLVPKSEYWETNRSFYNDNGDDVNFGNRQMWGVALENMKEVIRKNPDKERIMFGQQDKNSWDTSPKSMEIIDRYGANSATAVLCGNYLAKSIREWLAAEQSGRRIKVGIFAYLKSFAPPVVPDGKRRYLPSGPEMVFDEDLFVMLAPIETDYRYAYDDPANPAKNAILAETIKGWSALGGELMIWGYMQNFFYDFLMHFNSYNTMQSIYRFYKANHAAALYDQGVSGPTYGGTAFFELKQFLASKLAWDVDENVPEAVSRFMDEFYGEAAAPMKEYYESMIALTTYDYEQKGMDGGIYFDLLQNKFWPKGELDKWARLFDGAYGLIEPLRDADPARFTLLKDRLDKERITVIYMTIQFYPHYFTEAELLEMKLWVKETALRAKIFSVSELKSMSQLYAEWGV